MDRLAIFGLSILMSFLACAVVATVLILPNLRGMRREDALLRLVVPHTFRFVGLSFLVPGVVSTPLPSAFAVPAAYGDLVAAIFAMVAALGLFTRATWAIPAAWVLNVWGPVDLLHAVYQGQFGAHIDPSSLGATFFIPTVVVPALLTLHGLIFLVLLQRRS